MSVQQSYSINPAVGFPGEIAEPSSPHRVEYGVLHVASADTRANPRPGDALYWDDTNNAWRVAHNAATQLTLQGILSYRIDDIAGSDSILQYRSGDNIEVITMGVVWVTAGGAVERGQQIQMQTNDWKYNSVTRASAIADMIIVPVVCFSASGTDNAIVKAAIGYGRVI